LTGLLLVLPAVVGGIVAWKRRSLALAAVVFLLLGAAVWPWDGNDAPPGRAPAVARARVTQAAEVETRERAVAADAAIDEWRRMKGPDDPTELRTEAEAELVRLEGLAASTDPSIASAAESQIPAVQQRLFELQSAEVQYGELITARADTAAALAAAHAANVEAVAAIPPRPDASTTDTIRRVVAFVFAGLGVALLGAALARRRLRAQKGEPITWPSMFAPGLPAPPIIDRSQTPRHEEVIDLTQEERRSRTEPPVLRPRPSVPATTTHSARKRRRHN
jgi:hypothetical protein